MTVSGLVSYRRSGRPVALAKRHQRPPRLAGRGLHRLLALWSLPLLLIIALTGIYFFLGLGLGGQSAPVGKDPGARDGAAGGLGGALIDQPPRRHRRGCRASIPRSTRAALEEGRTDLLRRTLAAGRQPVRDDPGHRRSGDARGGQGDRAVRPSRHGAAQAGSARAALRHLVGRILQGDLGPSGFYGCDGACHQRRHGLRRAYRAWPCRRRGRGGRAARFKRGMGLLRWGYALALLAAVGAGFAIYGPFGNKPARIYPAEAGAQPVQLSTRCRSAPTGDAAAGGQHDRPRRGAGPGQ